MEERVSDPQFSWREMAQLFGGIAVAAIIQSAFITDDLHAFEGWWIFNSLFGLVYAALGGGIYRTFTRRVGT